jgi:hypothetical protein
MGFQVDIPEMKGRVQMAFINVARKKVADLIRREDFERILEINSEYVRLGFKCGKSCNVSALGKVEWFVKS